MYTLDGTGAGCLNVLESSDVSNAVDMAIRAQIARKRKHALGVLESTSQLGVMRLKFAVLIVWR